MDSPETANLINVNTQFLTDNAEYFAQSFMGLNDVFRNSGAMNIISEESKFVVAISMQIADKQGAIDMECTLLKPNQRSLRDCINVVANK
jgi:hypothetical protein